MPSLSRRDFLGTSFAGIGAALCEGPFSSPRVWSAESPSSKPKAGFDSLFLTWFRDPLTTIAIQWGGPSSQKVSAVNYRSLESLVWQSAPIVTKPFPGTDLKVYRSEITGLSAGTEYQFQIDTTSPEYRFRTMPAKATNEFTFVSGGDAGTGTAAVKSNEMAARQDPYFVMIGGDVAYDNGRSPETFLKFLQNYHATMLDSQKRLIPLVTCFGNHEVDGSYGGSRENAASFLSVFDGFYQENSFGVLDFGDYLSLVLLDTGHLSSVAEGATEWLKKTLAEREDHPHVFGINHVPCYPSYRNPWGKDGKGETGADQRKHWCPLFERYKINVVLEHHDHTFKRTHPLTDGMVDEKQGVLYLGDGSWGKIRPPKSPKERPYLAKVSESYHVTMHRLEGNRRFHVALTDAGRIADITMTVSKRAAT